MAIQKHKHTFKTVEQKVLLRRYRNEEGQSKYQDTSGYDMLIQRVCTCGIKETIDIERTVL